MFSLRNQHWRRGAKPWICATLLLTAFLAGAPAWAQLDPAFTRSIEDLATASLKFQYRLSPPVEVETLRVTQNGQPLAFRHTLFANVPQSTTALLVLVDTSAGSAQAPRDRTLEENKRLIQSLLAQARPSLSVGICAFSSDLVEVALPGTSFAEIQNNLARLKADGQGACIYRLGVRAVEKLAAVPATRKALLLLSDGRNADNGVTREDLVKAALRAHVTLFAMGCPETGADIPLLGSLEKLAAETHGLYAQARIGIPGPGERLKTDAAFVRDLLASLQSGGEVVVPLNTLAAGGDVVFEIVAKGGESFRYVHASGGAPLPPSPPVPLAPTAPVPAASVARLAALPPAPLSVATPAAIPSAPLAVSPPAPPSAEWLQRGLTPANLISAGSALLLVLAVLILRGRAQPQAAAPRAALPAAYLQMQDAESKRIRLIKTANRIGRHPENDIVFTNTSVSGYHAEIHVQRDGVFCITDLGSGNGLCVNNQQVAQAALKDGDLVELGEVRFRFCRG